jgi:hypothetical protein
MLNLADKILVNSNSVRFPFFSYRIYQRLIREIKRYELYLREAPSVPKISREVLVYSVDGIRHDVIPRSEEQFEVSNILMLVPLFGEFFSFFPTKADYIGADITRLEYRGIPVLSSGFVLAFDLNESRL